MLPRPTLMLLLSAAAAHTTHHCIFCNHTAYLHGSRDVCALVSGRVHDHSFHFLCQRVGLSRSIVSGCRQKQKTLHPKLGVEFAVFSWVPRENTPLPRRNFVFCSITHGIASSTMYVVGLVGFVVVVESTTQPSEAQHNPRTGIEASKCAHCSSPLACCG